MPSEDRRRIDVGRFHQPTNENIAVRRGIQEEESEVGVGVALIGDPCHSTHPQTQDTPTPANRTPNSSYSNHSNSIVNHGQLMDIESTSEDISTGDLLDLSSNRRSEDSNDQPSV